MKTCNKCNITKNFTEFSKAKSNKDGYSGQCKECKCLLTKQYRYTIVGKLTEIYNSQKASSKQRNHPLPKYSKKEFIAWANKHTQFAELFEKWKESNYIKDLSPSFDRLDDTKGYSFDNLRLVTWKENGEKLYTQRIKGDRITTQNKQIRQLSQDKSIVAEYESIAKAARENNFCRTNINNAIIKNRLAHGFYWAYI